MTTMPYVSTNDLSIGYRFGGKELLLFNKLNLSLSPGELTCLMGPNGSGKSSLIRTLAGLQNPLNGKITYAGGARSLPQQIAIVLTTKINALNMSAYEVVTYGRYPYLRWNISLTEKDRDVIDRSVAQTRIEALKVKRLYELSDGELQMVMIARALAQDTPVILLDEPTAHLDLNNRIEIMKLLRRLTRTTGKSILISTHDLNLALQVADYIWLAGNEKNILTGIPEDLVLNGAFDKVFEFKGFNLRTGRVEHESNKGKVQLTGDGFAYLWTKNALERIGLEVTAEESETKISIDTENDSLRWIVVKSGHEIRLQTLAEVIKSL